MEAYTKTELDMGRKGYVYLKDPKQVRRGKRAEARRITEYDRADLIFDHDAYKAHGHA